MASSPDLCLVPAVPAPKGHRSNFVNPSTLAPAVIAVNGIIVGWATIFVAIRLYTGRRRLTTGDYFSVIALAMSVTIFASVCTRKPFDCVFAMRIVPSANDQEEARTDRHIWDVPACFFDAVYARTIYVNAMLLNIGCFFAKASIFLLFFQIFAIHKSMRFAIIFGLTCTFMLYGAGVVVASIFETPHDGGGWVNAIGSRALIPLHWWQAQAALIVALDLYILMLPLPAVYKLNAPLRRRIAIAAVFSLALMYRTFFYHLNLLARLMLDRGIGASIASLIERIRVENSIDDTWISTILTLCSAVELNIAIIVGCSPGVAHFVKNSMPSLSVARSQLSSLLRFPNRTKTSTQASQSDSVTSEYAYPISKDPRYSAISRDTELESNLRHHPSDAAWDLQSHATGDQNGGSVNDATAVNGILRTTAVEQKTRRIDEETP